MEIARKRFPLKLAYASTVNKIQDQTLDRDGLDLINILFSHGQLYEALSRTRNDADLRILLPNERIINNVPHSKNIVYKELLL
ncbi:Hydra magnipapillata [Nesidiocoris tenuis]|uniref:Hydra magnipapillata n=1 Tax=Nesidiocoris tenuis TaxID=355587 RepID=A0ABN7ADG0_9HEMI|nr:Hydra magnipapillata [Nesidiocoris tenuis]